MMMIDTGVQLDLSSVCKKLAVLNSCDNAPAGTPTKYLLD